MIEKMKHQSEGVRELEARSNLDRRVNKGVSNKVTYTTEGMRPEDPEQDSNQREQQFPWVW